MEWIKWDGGECPVARGNLVDVRFRDGHESFGLPAGESVAHDPNAHQAYWDNNSCRLDIIAYRLHEPAEITTDAQQSTGIGYDLDCEFCRDNPEHPDCNNVKFVQCGVIGAHRCLAEPDDEQDIDECIGAPEASKYTREIKPGVFVDVYDVLTCWGVTNAALQHLIKKALQPGQRGHKDRMQDLNDILASAKRAIELESK